MMDGQANYLAILVVAIIANILGAIWYSPKMFGTIWAKASKIEMKKKPGAKPYILGFLMSLIMAAVVDCFVTKLDLTMVGEGLKLGFVLWLGMIATTQICAVLWSKKPFKLFMVDSGYYLVNLLIMGGVLATWR